MPTKRHSKISPVALFFLSMSAVAGAPMQLDWKDSSETLTYHSCGCADSCWVAELKEKVSRITKIRLSCDCTKVFLKTASAKKPKLYQPDCSKFEGQDKFEAITEEFRKIKEAGPGH